MKYTKEQMRAMSDFEVNKALAVMLDDFDAPPEGCVTEIIGDKLFYRNRNHGSYFECHKGYCEEASDIMPLAFEHGIWVQSVDGRDGRYWMAGANTYHAVQHENPLRAIACCLILVLQGEKE